MRFKCTNCGNEKEFYRKISVKSIERVTKEREFYGMPHNIILYDIDSSFEVIYCAECDDVIKEQS